MRIGIDARFYGVGGIGRYQSNLIRELEKLDKENDYFIFLNAEGFKKYKSENSRFKAVLADFKPYSFPEQFLFPFTLYKKRLDLVHFTHFNLPLFYLRSYVVTIHDLIMSEFPTQKTSTRGAIVFFFKRLGYELTIRWAIKRSEKIFAVSNATKEDIIRSFKIPADEIVVTYEGLDADLNKTNGNSEETLKKYGISKPYLLYVSSMYPHKNISRLAEAFAIIKNKKDIQLVLVGKVSYFSEWARKEAGEILGEALSKDVIFPNFQREDGYLPDEDLFHFYKKASLYVFPSLKEGFGLPLLEAMANSVPVCASNISCMPEIGGEAACYFNPYDPKDMAEKITKLMEDEKTQKKLIEKGLTQIKKFSWEKMARETLIQYFSL